MKQTIFTLVTFIFAIAAQAGGPEFSAFAIGDNLYVTVMGDSCNHLGGGLVVEDFCKADRKSRNAAPICSAKTEIWTTLMACGDDKLVPRVVTMSLKEQNVAPEAKVLNLKHHTGEVIEVNIER